MVRPFTPLPPPLNGQSIMRLTLFCGFPYSPYGVRIKTKKKYFQFKLNKTASLIIRISEWGLHSFLSSTFNTLIPVFQTLCPYLNVFQILKFQYFQTLFLYHHIFILFCQHILGLCPFFHDDEQDYIVILVASYVLRTAGTIIQVLEWY